MTKRKNRRKDVLRDFDPPVSGLFIQLANREWPFPETENEPELVEESGKGRSWADEEARATNEATAVCNRILETMSDSTLYVSDLLDLEELLHDWPTFPEFRHWGGAEGEVQSLSAVGLVRSPCDPDAKYLTLAVWSMADYVAQHERAPVRRCPHCDCWFQDATGGRARFCSPKCRNRFHYERGRAEKLGEKSA